MAYINASSALTRVKLFIIKDADATTPGSPVEADFMTAVSASTGAITLTTSNGPIVVPGLQDVTINNANGSFRWKQLDQGGENVITTNATNSLSGNFVLDPATFWGAGAGALATNDGIFKLSNDRTQVAFLIAPEGVVDKTVLLGTGFISALAPTVSADSPVWVSPITIEVNGDFIKFNSTLAV
ncbi:hypothetical protein UFOVP700_26 [uncultured Caudovirales phage]|uniref:Uncharacterized protein n=1 Tax=uncultured Caudovirales phage TaxID=2100421 RepID=A0A6J5NJ21_9CAUD|nr:hypothetical protein UFOVP700_26 [uncultured Caudovirales phage]